MNDRTFEERTLTAFQKVLIMTSRFVKKLSGLLKTITTYRLVRLDISEMKNSNLKVSLTINELEDICKWIFRYSGIINVLSPPE